MSFQIITFYEFKRFDLARLHELKDLLRGAMSKNSIKGTIILAEEGFNSTVCGVREDISSFVAVAEKILDTKLVFKSSFHDACPFRKVDVKIKPEIVTLKKRVDISKGEGTRAFESNRANRPYTRTRRAPKARRWIFRPIRA